MKNKIVGNILVTGENNDSEILVTLVNVDRRTKTFKTLFTVAKEVYETLDREVNFLIPVKNIVQAAVDQITAADQGSSTNIFEYIPAFIIDSEIIETLYNDICIQCGFIVRAAAFAAANKAAAPQENKITELVELVKTHGKKAHFDGIMLDFPHDIRVDLESDGRVFILEAGRVANMVNDDTNAIEIEENTCYLYNHNNDTMITYYVDDKVDMAHINLHLTPVVDHIKALKEAQQC